MDQKSENECEIQTAFFGGKGVMIRFRRVIAEEKDAATKNEEDSLLHNTKVLKFLIKSFFLTMLVVLMHICFIGSTISKVCYKLE
jgi:hypothetical protein